LLKPEWEPVLPDLFGLTEATSNVGGAVADGGASSAGFGGAFVCPVAEVEDVATRNRSAATMHIFRLRGLLTEVLSVASFSIHSDGGASKRQIFLRLFIQTVEARFCSAKFWKVWQGRGVCSWRVRCGVDFS
jgi:hypothetical protein